MEVAWPGALINLAGLFVPFLIILFSYVSIHFYIKSICSNPRFLGGQQQVVGHVQVSVNVKGTCVLQVRPYKIGTMLTLLAATSFCFTIAIVPLEFLPVEILPDSDQMAYIQLAMYSW